MACPLSAILNCSDQSPPQRRNADANNNDDGNRSPELQTRNPIQTVCLQSSSSSAIYGIPTPILLSEGKSSLYKRRAGKAPERVPILPTPLESSPPIHWVENEPPSYELDFRLFSVFKALLNHPELVFEFAKHLDVDDLVSLYAISKNFHNLVNSRFTTMILSQSVHKAHESSRIFIFRSYKPLCQRDPAARPLEAAPGEVRWVPSLRWLRMILFRERVVDEIITCLSAEGHFMPKRASLVIKKIWFTIDIGDNVHRIGIIHNREFWTDEDLYLATMFFLKLDLRFTHPVTGNGEQGMRNMLLGQRSLSTLLRVLKRQEMLSQLDLLRMIVEWNYRPAPHHARMSILGVPHDKIGKLRYEGWGKTRHLFIQIDQLVMREAIRRGLDLQGHYMDMITYGYVNKTTFEDVWHTGGPPGDEETEDDIESADEVDEREREENKSERESEGGVEEVNS
ncbi:hypothetical protein MMC29_001924 [Sticta canariensis]|nr:hypothetical protein [Sticta canariensis]